MNLQKNEIAKINDIVLQKISYYGHGCDVCQIGLFCDNNNKYKRYFLGICGQTSFIKIKDANKK